MTYSYLMSEKLSLYLLGTEKLSLYLLGMTSNQYYIQIENSFILITIVLGVIYHI